MPKLLEGELDKFVKLRYVVFVSQRPEYPLSLTINERVLTRVIIDQHYKLNHAESMTDDLILKLVQELDGGTFPIERVDDGHEYFTVEPVVSDDRPYRLILVLCLLDDYLGVVNAFRVDRRK